MNNLVRTLAPSAVLLAGTATEASAAEPDRAQRPNILFCIADDASYHHFGAAGCPWVSTPVFDRIAAQGLFFRNCYTPNAKSAPSRAVLLTGRNSWQLEEAGNHICNFPTDYKVFTEVLLENGYDVAFTGKGWGPGNPGRTEGQPRRLTGKPYQRRTTTPPTSGISKRDYAANFADFLDDNASSGHPWFFWFGANEPHRRYEYGSGVAVGGKKTSSIDRVPAFWPDTDTVRNDLLDYALEIEYYDRQVGRMLAELEKRGLLEQTLVIMTSDNGMPFPRAKANHYEYAHHMPLAVMWPAGIGAPGREIARYVSFTDIAPTLLEIAGVERERWGMRPVAGRSLAAELVCAHPDDDSVRSGRMIFGRERHDYGRPHDQGYPIRGIIRDGWMLIWNLKPERQPAGCPETGYLDIDGSPTKTAILELYRSGRDTLYFHRSMGLRPEFELYALDRDMDCMENLAEAPAHAERRKALFEELYSVLCAEEDPRMTGDGDVFDRYPFSDKEASGFYERVVGRQIAEPWKQTGWVEPSDYPQR